MGRRRASFFKFLSLVLSAFTLGQLKAVSIVVGAAALEAASLYTQGPSGSFGFNLKEHEIFATTSVGISLFPLDGTDTQTLLKDRGLRAPQGEEIEESKLLVLHFQQALPQKSLLLESDILVRVDSSNFVDRHRFLDKRNDPQSHTN